MSYNVAEMKPKVMLHNGDRNETKCYSVEWRLQWNRMQTKHMIVKVFLIFSEIMLPAFRNGVVGSTDLKKNG